VKKAIPKIIGMFIPGAGFIPAIISIYDTVMVFVQKISKIIQGRDRLHRRHRQHRAGQHRARRQAGGEHAGGPALTRDQLPRRLPGLKQSHR